jgi:hypothetical protein
MCRVPLSVFLKETRMSNLFQWCRLVLMGGVLFAGSGSCLPDNFWSGLLGDTIIAGATSVVVETVVSGFLGQ